MQAKTQSATALVSMAAKLLLGALAILASCVSLFWTFATVAEPLSYGTAFVIVLVSDGVAGLAAGILAGYKGPRWFLVVILLVIAYTIQNIGFRYFGYRPLF